MADEYQSSAEVYEAQFFQNEDDLTSFDVRPLKIMNLTKKISSKNNFSNFDEDEPTSACDFDNTNQGEMLTHETLLDDHSNQHSQTNFKLSQRISSHSTQKTTGQFVKQTHVSQFNGKERFGLPADMADYTEVYVWGSDSNGQLGIDSQFRTQNGKSKSRPLYHTLPRPCCFNVVIKQVSCGNAHAALLTVQGHLYTMGSNSHGQLGIGESNFINDQSTFQNGDRVGSPCLVETLRQFDVEQVSCGYDFTFAVVRQIQDRSQSYQSFKQFNSVYSWGNNSKGQLAQSDEIQFSYFPLKVESLLVLEDDIEQVSCGFEHVLILTRQLEVISCGNNKQGQCGFDPAECSQTNLPFKITGLDSHQVVQIAAGKLHSLFLTSEGKVFGAGSNTDFQIGVGLDLDQTSMPVLVQSLEDQFIRSISASNTSACISENGDLYIWGKGSQGSEIILPQKVTQIENRIVCVSLGDSASLALDAEGIVWSWGNNQYGQLGLSDTNYRPHPYQITNLMQKGITQLSTGGSFAICLGQNVAKTETLNQDILLQEPSFTFKVKRKSSRNGERRSRPTSQRNLSSTKENVRPRSNSKNKPFIQNKPSSTKNSVPIVKRQKSGVDNVFTQAKTPRENQITANTKNEDQSIIEQLKRLKMLNVVLKQENAKQGATISRLENKITKLQTNRFSQQQVIDLQLEVKKVELKVKQQREKRKQAKEKFLIAQQNIDQLQSQVDDLCSQLKNTQLKYQKVNDESYAHKMESNKKDTVISQLEAQISQYLSKIQAIQDEKLKEEEGLKSKIKQLQSESDAKDINLQNSNFWKSKLERDLKNCEETMKKKEEYILSLEQENQKLSQDLNQQKIMKKDYESFVSGLSAPVQQQLNKSVSPTSFNKKVSSLNSDIQKQFKDEKAARQQTELYRPQSQCISHNSTEKIERNNSKEIQCRQENLQSVERNYKSFLALTEPIHNFKQTNTTKNIQNSPPRKLEATQSTQQEQFIVKESVSLRDLYSEKLIKNLEAKALAKQKVLRSVHEIVLNK